MARKINTKRCTFTGEELPATPEFFYRDKSQKDGLSPWSKAGERAYNAAYHQALKAAGVTRVRDLDDKGRARFNRAMARAKVRIARKGRIARDTTIQGKARANRARRTNRKNALKASNSA